MKNFVRGANVHISITFKDNDGNIVTPTGANLTFSYVPKNNTAVAPPRTFVTYPMVAPTSPDTDWTYDWDSSVAEATVVDCHAATNTPNVPISSVDFQFRLTANRANKELAGDDDTWGSGWGTGYWR